MSKAVSGSSDSAKTSVETSSELSGMFTTNFAAGEVAFVNETKSYYGFDPLSTLAIDGKNVLGARTTGRWLVISKIPGPQGPNGPVPGPPGPTGPPGPAGTPGPNFGVVNPTEVSIVSAFLKNADLITITETFPKSFSFATNCPRALHTATFLPRARVSKGFLGVLLAGGRGASDGQGPSAEIVEVSANDLDNQEFGFRPTLPMNTVRYGHRASLLPDGRVLVTGGFDSAGNILNSAEIFDPATDAWTLAAPMHVARAFHAQAAILPPMVLLPSVMVTNGLTGTPHGSTKVTRFTEIYDVNANIWNFGPPTADFHTYSELIQIPIFGQGRLGFLITGGSNQPLDGWIPGVPAQGQGLEPGPILRATTELYDPIQNAWTGMGNLNIPRALHTTGIINDRLFLSDTPTAIVAGGLAITSPFEPATDSIEFGGIGAGWGNMLGSKLNVARWFAIPSINFNGKVFVHGGFISSPDGTGTKTLDEDEIIDQYRHANTLPSNSSQRPPKPANLAEYQLTLLPSNTGRTKVLISGGIQYDATNQFYLPSSIVSIFYLD